MNAYKKKNTKRPDSKKRSKTAQLKIHKTKPIEPDEIPNGSNFRYYKDFVVQDIFIETFNTKYRLKVYETPDGEYVSGTLPAHLNDKHFGPTVITFILYQYCHCHVIQPLLLEQLGEIGIDISVGQLNNLLIEEKDRFHLEKDRKDLPQVGHIVLAVPQRSNRKHQPNPRAFRFDPTTSDRPWIINLFLRLLLNTSGMAGIWHQMSWYIAFYFPNLLRCYNHPFLSH